MESVYIAKRNLRFRQLLILDYAFAFAVSNECPSIKRLPMRLALLFENC